MASLENALAVQLAQPDYPVLNQDPVAGTFLEMVPRVPPAGIGAQVENAGTNRQALNPGGSTIPGVSPWHSQPLEDFPKFPKGIAPFLFITPSNLTTDSHG